MISKNNFSETLFSYKIQNFASNTAIDATRKLATEAKYTLRFFSNESKIRKLFDFLYKQVTIENRHFSYADGNLTVTALMREPKHRRKMLSVLLESKQHISSSSSIPGVYSQSHWSSTTMYHKNKEFCVFKSTNRETTILRFESNLRLEAHDFDVLTLACTKEMLFYGV